MPGVSITQLARNASVGVGKKDTEPDFTMDIRVVMQRTLPEDPMETGWDVINYIRNNGYEFGTKYSPGGVDVEGVFLTQIDPPVLVEDSNFDTWDVTLHYTTGQRDQQNQGAKDPTFIRPSISVSTTSSTEAVEKALYRGGTGGPGGSPRLKITPNDNAPPTVEVEDGVEDDGSYSFCVNRGIVPNSWGNIDILPVGSVACGPITNSANQPYNPAPTRTVTNGTIKIVRNVYGAAINGNSFPVDWINNRGVVIFSRTMVIPIFPYTMKLAGWTMDEVFDKSHDLEYIKITGTFELNPRGWRKKVLDSGLQSRVRAPKSGTDCNLHMDGYEETDSEGNSFRQMWAKAITKADLEEDGGNGCFQDSAILNERTGEPITAPVPLDGNGSKLGKTVDGIIEATGVKPDDPGCAEIIYQTPVYGYWSVYNEIDPLPLPFFRGMIRPL